MASHELSDSNRLDLEVSLYGQKKAWLAHSERGLAGANERLLQLIPRDETIPEPAAGPMDPRQVLLGALEHQSEAVRTNNQPALQQANERILAARQQFEATSPDKR